MADLDIARSLRWHNPGRFNGYVLSQHVAGTAVDVVNLRDALRSSRKSAVGTHSPFCGAAAGTSVIAGPGDQKSTLDQAIRPFGRRFDEALALDEVIEVIAANAHGSTWHCFPRSLRCGDWRNFCRADEATAMPLMTSSDSTIDSCT